MQLRERHHTRPACLSLQRSRCDIHDGFRACRLLHVCQRFQWRQRWPILKLVAHRSDDRLKVIEDARLPSHLIAHQDKTTVGIVRHPLTFDI